MEADTRQQTVPGAFPEIPEPDGNHAGPAPTQARAPRRKFVGRQNAEAQARQKTGSENNGSVEETAAMVRSDRSRRPRALNQIPDEIMNDPAINEAVALLPANYSFEIHKTIHRIRSLDSKRIALQFPEGLLLFATTISDILSSFCPGTEYLIMGDVTYGACCIDDYTARALECDLLVHYAHSCLIPISREQIATLYIFVDIGIDERHLFATLTRNFPPGKTLAMVSTVQFNSTLHTVRPQLEAEGLSVLIPQISPLSKGEVLGCTAPRISTKSPLDTTGADALLYLGDGRFHLEAAMIANPSLPAYRYDPYSRTLTRESYGHEEMLGLRASAIQTARSAKQWGLVLGALGRQGNPHTLTLIEQHLTRKGIPFVNLLLSEIFPAKLALFEEDVECWVQIACPRLSIDWGYAFARPLLTPYEALVALGAERGWQKSETGEGDGVYPMNYYANRGLGRTTEKSVRLDLGVEVGTREVEVA